MVEAVKPEEVRKARAYLQRAGIGTGDISPKRFAAVSKEKGMSFRETLKYLAILLMGGQGMGPAPISTAGRDRLNPTRAIGRPNERQEAVRGQVSG